MTSTLLKSFHCNNQPALRPLLEPTYAFSAIRAAAAAAINAAAAALVHVVVEEPPSD